MTSMKIKVILGQDIRLWRYSVSECNLSSLKEFVSSPSSFGLSSFWLQWEDDEGDRITLQEEHDLKGALCCAQEEDRKSLKIYVVRGSNRSAQKKEKQSNPNTNTAATAASGASAVGFDSDSELDRCAEMRGIAMDFLQNPEITKLLPDLHRRFFEEIKRCKEASDRRAARSAAHSGTAEEEVQDGADSDFDFPFDLKWDSAENLERILRVLLESESKFEPIVSHPLFVEKLNGMIPVLCRKMCVHLPILMGFRTEAIAAWIPHLASVLGHGVNTFDSFGSSAMSSFFPLMCSFMTHFAGNGTHWDRDCDGNVLHHGVRCDHCDVAPIKGARFKCAVCANFDLCAQCEAKREHDANHPLIKFNGTAASAVPPFCGLHEMMTSFGSGPQKWFGPHWRSRFNQQQPHRRNASAPDRQGDGDRNLNRSERAKAANGRHSAFGHPAPSMAPPPGMAMQPHPGWWNHDGDHHWGPPRGHRGWRRWNRWQSHHGPHGHGQWGPHSQNVQRNGGWNGVNGAHSNQSHGPRAQHQQQQHQQQQSQRREYHREDVVNDNVNCPSSAVPVAPAKERKIKVMAEFVTDVNLPDRTYYPTDTVLTKTWRMKNSGDHEWGTEVELVFFKGNESLTLEKRYPVNNAQPGQMVEVSAVIKTPTKPGRYCSYYRLQRNREFFGPRVWVDIFAVEEDSKAVPKGQSEPKDVVNEVNVASAITNMNGRKYKRKEAKLNAKQKRIASKMEAVSKELAAGGLSQSDAKLVKVQGKLQRKQERVQQKVDRLRAKSLASNVDIGDVSEQQQPVNGDKKAVDELQLLDDIANAAVQDLNAVPLEEAMSSLSVLSCVCGSTLRKTSPIEAYQSRTVRVECDICRQLCPSNSAIYHCPQKGNNGAHPGGYDVCAQCLEFQMQGFVGQQAGPSVRQLQPLPPSQMEANQQSVYPKLDAAVQPVQAMEPVPVPAPEFVSAPFVYQQQLEQLKAMGFEGHERMKQELVQQQGNVQRVANRLLQQ